MDKIEERLRETSENCFKAFEAWSKNKKDHEARESLQDSVHELRKVASRLEIEMATSERDEMTAKPIPIPPHRSSSKGGGSQNILDHDDMDQQPGNDMGAGGRGKKSGSGGGGGQNRRRRSGGGGQKKAASGGE